jgi:hypothetical protein
VFGSDIDRKVQGKKWRPDTVETPFRLFELSLEEKFG